MTSESEKGVARERGVKPSVPGRSRWLLIGVFLLAFGLRAGYVLTLPDTLRFADARKYRLIARSLRAGRGFAESGRRHASRAPGYPLFLALVPGGAEGSLLPVRLVQGLIGAAACILLWALARRLFDARVGLVAAAMAAVYPFHIFLAGCALSEVIFMFLLIATALALDHVGTRPERPGENSSARRRFLWAGAAGLLVGLATLTRSSLLLLPLFLLPFWLIAIPRRGVLARWALVICGMALAVSPWVWRNHRLFGRFIPTTLQVGESLYEANNPNADGGPMIDRIDWEAATGHRELDEYEWDRFFRGEALRYMRAHPWRTARLALVKLGRFWNPLPNHPPLRKRPLVVVAGLVSYVPLLLLGGWGLYCLRRRWRRVLVLLAPILYYSLLHMVFVGSVRYRTPVMPLLMIPAAFGLCELWRRRSAREAL